MIFTRRGKFGIDSIKNSQGSIMNKYVPGSGVGATSIFARRAKLYRSPPKIAEAAPSPPINTPSLNTIAAYLRNYMVEFRNTNFWSYTMDGNNIYISDGGNDMFDTGMFITPWLLSGNRYDIDSTTSGDYPYAIQYDTITETVVDTDLKYISLGYILDTDTPQDDQSLHPLTVICYRESGPVGWQNGGNIGADGGGIAIHGYVYENTVVNGFTVYAGYRQVYNAGGDPTICQLVILLGHSSWGSVFGPVTIISNNSDKQYCQFVMYAGAGSQNILAVNVLLSKNTSNATSPISDSELQSIVSNYITRIKESCSL
jgi:hypothetical protein